MAQIRSVNMNTVTVTVRERGADPSRIPRQEGAEPPVAADRGPAPEHRYSSSRSRSASSVSGSMRSSWPSAVSRSTAAPRRPSAAGRRSR